MVLVKAILIPLTKTLQISISDKIDEVMVGGLHGDSNLRDDTPKVWVLVLRITRPYIWQGQQGQQGYI